MSKDVIHNFVDFVAHWKFSKDYVKSGSLQNGDLVICDASGNGNDLRLVTVGDASSAEASEVLKWSEDNGNNLSGVHSLEFSNYKNAPVGRCFRTGDDAPINYRKFEEGFTIEAIIKLPEDFTPDKHSWMGILTRQGQADEIDKTGGEKETLSTLSVSSLREMQWTSYPVNLNYNVTNWSFSLDSKEKWYHIAIVNDGRSTTLYINGVTDFRNPPEVIKGIDAVPGKGWNIGASEWGGKIDTLFAGNIQEIRIADRALPQNQWLDINFHKGNSICGTNDYIPLTTGKYNYNFLFIPDPQKTVRYKPEIFETQMKWMADNLNSHNIAISVVLGDIVDQSSETCEWAAADKAISILDEHEVPYLIAAGNHDYHPEDPFLNNFGPNRYEGKQYYKGSSPSGYSSYAIISAGSYNYLFLTVDMKHLYNDIDWAKDVLNSNKYIPTVIFSHEMLKIEGDGSSVSHTRRGDVIWNELVKESNQVFMTVCGHNHGSFYKINENVYGYEVVEILVDYQSCIRGGNGWMRFVEFDELSNKIHFRTYSPWIDLLADGEHTCFDVRYLTGSNDMFEINIDFKERFSFYKR